MPRSHWFLSINSKYLQPYWFLQQTSQAKKPQRYIRSHHWHVSYFFKIAQEVRTGMFEILAQSQELPLGVFSWLFFILLQVSARSLAIEPRGTAENWGRILKVSLSKLKFKGRIIWTVKFRLTFALSVIIISYTNSSRLPARHVSLSKKESKRN